jgi:tetratricopeptide (TPR) repeat protein
MRRWWILGVVVLALACQSEEEQRAAFQARADEYIEAEQWKEAKIELLNLSNLDPTDAETHHKLSQAQGHLREFGDSLWHLSEAHRLAPDNLDWGTELASFYFLVGRMDDARNTVQSVLARDPEHVQALILSARLHSVDREMDAMEETLDRLAVADPDNSIGLTMRAQLYSRREQYEEAEKALRQLVEAEPSPGSHLVLALFLASRERDQQAQEQFEKAIEVAAAEDLVEQVTQARMAYASYLVRRGDFDAAEQLLLESRDETPESEEILLRLAVFYQATGRPERALAMLEEVVSHNPEEVGPRMALAEFLQRSGDLERAIEEINKALAVAPESEAARLVHAQLLLESSPSGSEQAKQIVAGVLQENPNSIAGLFTQSKFLVVDGEYEKAAQLLRRVIQEQPSASASLLLGITYVRMGQDDLARAEFVQALQLDETNYVARSELASLYLRSGNRQLAAQEAERALQQRPGDPKMLLTLADSRIGLGLEAEALAALEVLQKVNWDSVSSPDRLRLASSAMYQRMGRTDEAAALIQEVLDAKPGDPAALRQLRNLYVVTGRPRDALAPLNRGIELAPDSAVLYELRGELYLGFRKADGTLLFGDEAEQDLRTALEKDPSRASVHQLLGRLHERRGQIDQAMKSYREAIRLDSHNVQAHVDLARLYEQRGQPEEAIALYEKLVSSGADEPILKNNLAWLLASGKSASAEDLDRAQALAQDAKEALPQNPDVADTLGYVMLKKGVGRAAIALFREALEGGRSSEARASTRYFLAIAYESVDELERAVRELEVALQESEGFQYRNEAEAMLKRLRAA